jgi:hypothetical protein
MSAEHDNSRRSSGAGRSSEDESGHALASMMLNEGGSASGTTTPRMEKPALSENGEPLQQDTDKPPNSPPPTGYSPYAQSSLYSQRLRHPAPHARDSPKVISPTSPPPHGEAP